MKNHLLVPAVLVGAVLISGCASVPNSNLDEARSRYESAQSDQRVATLAPAELRLANEALKQAEAAWKQKEDVATVNHLAYVTKQRTAIADQAANQRAADERVANASAERNKILLGVRTDEAAAALARAEAAQRQAEMERARADALEQQTAEAAARQRELDAKLSELEAKQTERGMVITLGAVLFDIDGTAIKAGGMRAVEKLAEFLKQYPERKVMIEGYTDSTGPDEYNQDLSRRRAESVRTALQGIGIAADRVVAMGHGESFPVATNDTPAGRQLNRRVEIVISDETGQIVPR